MRGALRLVFLGLAGCCLSVTGISEDGGGTTGGASTGGASTGGGSAGACVGSAPINHRPSDAQCQGPAPAGNFSCSGNCPTGPLFTCNGDAECDAGLNGRCVEGCCIASSRCTYDQCTFDTDCPAGETCACHGSTYLPPSDSTCVAGDCRVDADCGAGCGCSPSQQAGCWGCLSYHCHTPRDLCVDDDDCGPENQGQFCVYSSDAGYWECVVIQAPL